jgi:hypothetical protein
MKPALLLLVAVAYFSAHAAVESKLLAVSDWSEPVGYREVGKHGRSIRGRLLICEGYSSAYTGKTPETQVYLELHNVSSGVGSPIELYCDVRDGLQCELLDGHGQAAPTPPTFNGGFPEACWITLPHDATVRLRASWYGHGTQEGSDLRVPFYHELAVPAGTTNFTPENCTYEILAPGMRSDDTNIAFLRCTIHGHLGYSDSTVFDGVRRRHKFD